MVFTRFVEVGRVALVNYGPDAGKLVVILDVMDTNKALVAGPCTGVERQTLQFRRMALTDIKVKISRGARNKQLVSAWTKADVAGQWAKTSWAQKLAKKAKRAESTDFSRFKTMIARKKRSAAITK